MSCYFSNSSHIDTTFGSFPKVELINSTQIRKQLNRSTTIVCSSFKDSFKNRAAQNIKKADYKRPKKTICAISTFLAITFHTPLENKI